MWWWGSFEAMLNDVGDYAVKIGSNLFRSNPYRVDALEFSPLIAACVACRSFFEVMG